jgi:hypothetical protein
MAQMEYTHVEPPRDDHAHIRFTGPFQGRQVIWDARIVTLEHECRERQSARQPPGDRPGLRQFIDVGSADEGIRHLRIGLNVERIDEPVILKVIIMIRQYKRLHEGCHEYGQAWSPALQP